MTLFIVKQSYRYDGERQVSRGLLISARMVAAMLEAAGFEAKVAEAVDGNSIDHLVMRHRPARVVIEAIWVTPAKMAELLKLWPRVRWTVRVHSEFPFLANEGMAIEWLLAYLSIGVGVAFNARRALEDFSLLGHGHWLPNAYLPEAAWGQKGTTAPGESLQVGCFGAIRPLKNQLLQAVAAVRFCRHRGKGLVFHMNGSRLEQFGENNLKNIAAFLRGAGASLRLHPWLDHEEFRALVSEMDFCLQVSLTESFCIVAADAVSQGVALIGSPAIEWLPSRAQADPLDSESIVERMAAAGRKQVAANRKALARQMAEAAHSWRAWLEFP
jgi:hypothetical protein